MATSQIRRFYDVPLVRICTYAIKPSLYRLACVAETSLLQSDEGISRVSSLLRRIWVASESLNRRRTVVAQAPPAYIDLKGVFYEPRCSRVRG